MIGNGLGRVMLPCVPEPNAGKSGYLGPKIREVFKLEFPLIALRGATAIFGHFLKVVQSPHGVLQGYHSYRIDRRRGR